MTPSTDTPRYEPTDRTRLRIKAMRGTYEQPTVHAILDEALLCHVGITTDRGPVVIPTTYARIGETLYLHGSPASRLLKSLQAGVDVCVTVTLLDGLVLARSAMHHSMNYRSVVIFGTAVTVTDAAEKLAAMQALVEHVVPGRWAEVRPPSEQELAKTLVLALPISEASAKIRSGPPVDDPADLSLPVWAGELPLRLSAGAPVADDQVSAAMALPASVGQVRPGLGRYHQD